MSRVSYFEFSAVDMDRAMKFWASAFGWKFEKWAGMDYYAVKTGPDDQPGIDGGLTPREKDNQVVNNIEVADIDATLEAIVRHGGRVLVAKSEIPGVGHYAIFADTEDNTFSIMKSS